MIAPRWRAVLLWIALIFTLTSIPNPSLPRVTGGDKVGHLIMYGVLGGLVGRASRGHPHPLAARGVAFLAIGGLAALDEWHQRFIPGRSAESGDWLADVAGAGLGLALTYAAQWRREST